VPPPTAEGIHIDAPPDLAVLRRSLAGTTGPIGPLLSQSGGIAADDGRLEPYWSLAEELDRPVAIALGPAPSAAPVPNYRVALGDPMKLEPVLARHPRLRVIVVGAGWPFADAMVGVLKRYAQVSVDIRPLIGTLPDAELQAYVRRLADAGFGARIVGN
jgi:predicted TIM-barrel fold metal-dependent hydrolase